MINGNMACGVNRNNLIVRVGSDAYEEALSLPNVKPFDMTGSPMKGWIVVSADDLIDDDALESWIICGLTFVSTLSPK